MWLQIQWKHLLSHHGSFQDSTTTINLSGDDIHIGNGDKLLSLQSLWENISNGMIAENLVPGVLVRETQRLESTIAQLSLQRHEQVQ